MHSLFCLPPPPRPWPSLTFHMNHSHTKRASSIVNLQLAERSQPYHILIWQYSRLSRQSTVPAWTFSSVGCCTPEPQLQSAFSQAKISYCFCKVQEPYSCLCMHLFLLSSLSTETLNLRTGWKGRSTNTTAALERYEALLHMRWSQTSHWNGPNCHSWCLEFKVATYSTLLSKHFKVKSADLQHWRQVAVVITAVAVVV